ncbi:MAG: methyl-accepting chemotaxis protein [Oligoflexia bacterium]|nr:methyl-accepting chemotaxis protein [Oligoflexia bacterium]
MKSKPKENTRIYFWERIAFRISLGFIIPVAVSAYALQSISVVYTEQSEKKERVQRYWASIKVSEGKVLLNLAKLRIGSQLMVNQTTVNDQVSLVKEQSKSGKTDLEQSLKMLRTISEETEVHVDHQLDRSYQQIFNLFIKLSVQAQKMERLTGNMQSPEFPIIKREIEEIANEIETQVGRLRAKNELYEMKVLERLLDKEKTSSKTLGWYLIAVLVFGLVAALVVTYSIVAPMKVILHRLVEIATGDGDLTIRIQTRSGGELKELAFWMNTFLDKTESIISTISGASKVVSETTNMVGNYTQNTSIAASGINKSMMEQSMNIDECASSIGSIDDLIQSSGESTRQAASLSKIAMDRALQGGASVHETIEAMEKIEESSKKIEELVSSINEIASQTNLLAINAAIEATKAGEHGKGFAVVAEEVRKLAERSRKLTGEVNALIGESSGRVKAGVNLAKTAGVSLDGIIKDVEAVVSLIQRIAASASKQTESSSIVLNFVQKISEGVRLSLKEMEEVTNASELTSLEVTRLNSLVGQLNQIVGQFKFGIGIDVSNRNDRISRNEGDMDSEDTLPIIEPGLDTPASHSGLAPLLSGSDIESEEQESEDSQAYADAAGEDEHAA